ncbi:MAG: hypothetical protein HY738_17705 [Bacteroidia bacterium]|nr:hypothetical protein [Bacteroidia bacterium]
MEAGITLTEVKRVSTTFDNLASVISDVLEESKNCMFYLKHTGKKYLFSTEPTLYSIVNVKMDNIKHARIEELQRKLFAENIGNNKLKSYYLPRATNDVPDTQDFKLLIFNERNDHIIKELIEKKGSSPRVNRNTIFSLVPVETEKARFENNIKKFLAYEEINKDSTLNLSVNQLTEVKLELICKYFREQISPMEYDDYVIIEVTVCKEQKEREKQSDIKQGQTSGKPAGTSPYPDDKEIPGSEELPDMRPPVSSMTSVNLRFDVPMGKTSSLVGMLNLLQRNFQKLNITIDATEGQMTEQDYDDKIKETLRQMGVEV